MNDNTLEALEAKLTIDLKHTLKLMPSSQRDLFIFELAKYIQKHYRSEAQITQMVKDIIDSDEKAPTVILKPIIKGRNALREQQRHTARKYGLEIEK